MIDRFRAACLAYADAHEAGEDTLAVEDVMMVAYRLIDPSHPLAYAFLSWYYSREERGMDLRIPSSLLTTSARSLRGFIDSAIDRWWTGECDRFVSAIRGETNTLRAPISAPHDDHAPASTGDV